jgi:hypothetical protein
MKTASIIQAVIILLIVASAASCATGKEYADRVFAKKTTPVKDSVKIRFIEEDSIFFESPGEYIALQKEKNTMDSLEEYKPVPSTEKPVPVTSTGTERTRKKRD